MTDLKPYEWRPWPASDWAILVFARDRQEAKKVGFRSGMSDDLYTDCRVRRLEATGHIMRQAVSNEPHYIDSPEYCDRCEVWGVEPCTCREDGAWDD